LSDGSKWYACSRRYAVKEPENEAEDNFWWSVARRYGLREKLQTRPGLFIQGEIAGPKIQNNSYRLKTLTLYLFAAFDTNAGEYLSLAELQQLAADLGVETVPVIQTQTKLATECGGTATVTVKALLTDASGKSALCPQTMREGVVYTNTHRVRLSDRVILKCISNEFLLKKKD
jgi:hypothetical protein